MDIPDSSTNARAAAIPDAHWTVASATPASMTLAATNRRRSEECAATEYSAMSRAMSPVARRVPLSHWTNATPATAAKAVNGTRRRQASGA
ncbi:hypothetical protein [Actinomadura sp. DC4]|uniref:hypothetical protein n=1 Tax=Actinomadura sp. DC4 TaxID=3055069 RepID=UPI0025B093D3|nr:hypothetical protein [Actinomadura sp. DC4]MDN3357813.1 hypothetical protein [Actinomadura sp. DC4]